MDPWTGIGAAKTEKLKERLHISAIPLAVLALTLDLIRTLLATIQGIHLFEEFESCERSI
jgi:hypothetical protein